MNTENNISQELEAVAPALLNISRTNIYTLPAGYFEELAGTVMGSIKLAGLKSEPSLANPFAVPQDYFDGLASQILSKVQTAQNSSGNEVAAELNEIAPLLNTINKQPVFSVPSGYFEGLQPTGMLEQKAPAKIISGTRFSRFTRYAAAAVITGLIATGGILFLNKPANVTVTPPIANVQEYHPEDVQDLSVEDIAEFLDTHSSPSDAISSATTLTSDLNMSTDVQDIPDNELQQYLKENPEPGDPNNTGS